MTIQPPSIAEAADAVLASAISPSRLTSTAMTKSSSTGSRACGKRKRTSALTTPPASNDPSDDDNFTQAPKPPAHTLVPSSSSLVLPTALTVLAASARALTHIHAHYTSSQAAQAALSKTIDLAATAHGCGARLIVAGVGKSGIVAQKTAATLRSLGVAASFLHAADALHGDLGDVRENDVLLCVSASGSAPELMALMSHIPSRTAVVAISALGAGKEASCRLLQIPGRGDQCGARVLLPACIGEDEAKTLGVRAPMPSTTAAMVVGDMLALTLAERIHGDRGSVKSVFDRNHPGGAIGVVAKAEQTEAPGLAR